MEFGLFIQGFVPGKKSQDPREEYAAFQQRQDRNGLYGDVTWAE